MSVVDVPQGYDCLREGHLDAVSGCCGSGEYPEVDGMCGACREFTGWMCSFCDEDLSDEVYSMWR